VPALPSAVEDAEGEPLGAPPLPLGLEVSLGEGEEVGAPLSPVGVTFTGVGVADPDGKGEVVVSLERVR
jgi:hypothetical protein